MSTENSINEAEGNAVLPLVMPRFIKITECDKCLYKFPTMKNGYRCTLVEGLNNLPKTGISDKCPLPILNGA
jgi:hypothetical protein